MNIGDREWIAARIPHQGVMCLLDSVRRWDQCRALCVASSHRRPDNPLRFNERLGAVCAIEYAAQAIAVHSALLVAHHEHEAGQSGPAAGYLASARAVDFFVARLDDIDTDLDIEVERLSGDDVLVLYQFTVRGNATVLAQGRAAVMLDATSIAVEK